MNWYIKVLKNFTDFQGRARRKEYWMFALIHFIIMIILVSIDMFLGLGGGAQGYGILSGLYSLILLIPSLAVAVRRLHDTGKSGWWILIGFVPAIGAIVLLIFMLLDSQSGSNKWGNNPKGE